VRPNHLLLLAALAGLPALAGGADLAFLRPAPASASSADRAAAPARHDAPATASVVHQVDWYDPGNPDARLLQRPDQALSGLPRDRWGFVDWMKALRQGHIAPRQEASGKPVPVPAQPDVIMRNTKEMPYVRFPHGSHSEWLACDNCHPAPFEPRAGANSVTMADIFRGKACGLCHDRVAFVTYLSCERCHSVPRDAGQERK
jgi:c(7)-type cytochrome triheme protein